MSALMIEIKNLAFSYGGHPIVFDDFDLTINRGDSWAVIGPSGCGKTTLLYLLAGLRRPSRGKILIDGSIVSRPRPQTGLVLQDHGLLPWATVRENVTLGLKIRKFYGPDGRHAPRDTRINKDMMVTVVDEWMRRLGIDGLEDKYPSQLSRGQRQRVAIARTLALEPDLLMMDEPFSALDAAIREDLQKAIITFHNESDLTSIIVTHVIEEAIFMGGKILLLNGPSNHEPKVIPNSLAGRSDYRDARGFRDLFENLRELLEPSS